MIIGYNTGAAGTGSFASNYLNGSYFALPAFETEYIRQVGVYSVNSYPTARVRIAIYRDAPLPKNLLFVTDEKVGLAVGWNLWDIRSSPLVDWSATQIFIGVLSDTSLALRTYTNAAVRDIQRVADTYADGPAATLGTLSSAGYTSQDLAVYVETATGDAVRPVDYTDFFLGASSEIVQLETFEISHPNFSQTYYLVRNAINGLVATDENSVQRTFVYYPLQITPSGARDNLDASLRISLGDLGSVLPTELDAVAAANGFATKPTLKYRVYRSDILTAPMFGPINLEITDISFSRVGVTFEAKAPSLNNNKTGQLYTIERFPMLRGFL